MFKISSQEQGVQKAKQPFHAWVLDWVETIVTAFAIVTVVFTFIARVVTVDGGSMEPNYYDGDRVLVTSLAGEAQRGDVVIIVHTLDETLIKRVVATEGQVVDFDDDLGELIVDGQVVSGDVYGTRNGITFASENAGDAMEFPQTVPEGCVFVLGDHRDNSTDSRKLSVGMVDRRNILGRVVFNLYPVSKAGPVG